MASDILQYVDVAFNRHRRPQILTGEPRAQLPTCSHGDFQGDGCVFFGLHPNKSVVPHPMANMHTHDYLEIMFVRKGNCQQLVDDRTIKNPAGSIVLLNTGTYHQPWVDSSDDIVVNMGVKTDTVLRILSGIGDHQVSGVDTLIDSLVSGRADKRQSLLHIPNAKDIDALITDMFCEYFQRRALYEQVMLADLVRLMIELVRRTSDPDQHAEPHQQAVQAYIEENYTGLSMQQLCEHFNYSERHMRRLLRTISDDSLPNMLNRMRIEKACEYIGHLQMSTEEILQRTGFNDTNYFYRTFKTIVGESVSDYRQRHRF